MTKDAAEVTQKAYDITKEYVSKYHGAVQGVIAGLQDTFGMRNDDIFKAATGLMGGVGNEGDSGCGAYLGAVIFASSILGRERDNFADPTLIRRKTAVLVQKLHAKFIQEYGCINCRDIQTKLTGRPYYLADSDIICDFCEWAPGKLCCNVAGNAARWMAEILLEENLVDP
jgi:hypothetical protein